MVSDIIIFQWIPSLCPYFGHVPWASDSSTQLLAGHLHRSVPWILVSVGDTTIHPVAQDRICASYKICNLSSLCETLNHQVLIILLPLHRFDSSFSCTSTVTIIIFHGITAFTYQKDGEDKTTCRLLIVTVSPPWCDFCLSLCHSVSLACLTLGTQATLSYLWLSLSNGLIFTSCLCSAVPFVWKALSLII